MCPDNTVLLHSVCVCVSACRRGSCRSGQTGCVLITLCCCMVCVCMCVSACRRGSYRSGQTGCVLITLCCCMVCVCMCLLAVGGAIGVDKQGVS